MGFTTKKLAFGLLLAGALAAATTAAMSKPYAHTTEDPVVNEYDTSAVNVDSLLDVMAAGPTTSPPSDWIPGIGNIPAILIRPCFPPGSDPTVIPTGPAAPYTPWSPWKFPPSWVPNVPPPAGPYPCGRIPGKIKWNPTRPGWDFVTPGMPPIPLSSTVTSTPIGGTPANATPVNIGGAPGTLTPGDGSISGD